MTDTDDAAVEDGSRASVGAPRARRRVRSRRWFEVVATMVVVGPWLLGGFGGPLLALFGDLLDDRWPGLRATATTTLVVAIQVLICLEVLIFYWLPRWVDLVLPDGSIAPMTGGSGLGVLVVFPLSFLLIGALIFADAGELPPLSALPVMAGSLIMIVPAALHRAIERRHHPERRMSDGL